FLWDNRFQQSMREIVCRWLSMLMEKKIFSKNAVMRKVESMGFLEAADIIRFLSFFCDGELKTSECVYIRSKVDECLRSHDDTSDYFIGLRELASELDAVIYFNRTSK
ncbi:TPA: hypothetical protein ACJ2XJ_005000, partial [Enterobacter cloacae]